MELRKYWVPLFFLVIFFLACNSSPQLVSAQSEESLEWPMSMSGLYDEELEDGVTSSSRRSLLWNRAKYYISYAALSANRIPCPPRSGRSYYTHNCYFASGPVHPYTRGCSAITRCRR
ncbi:OLC1v1010160C1 [Oldenlandia corymbosa var. corymbosa]|uniref:OLC1v1010160C1 n=1 Tax=Oldenlandia corymbosa var. corymbosa TaxID=529605 RepID=A0AAV1DQR0_OLDCO|nr:OLC1v1010160C1 [Oldenlandia corymbosa var. corymbosa]